jgi:hypothetical protein
VLLRTLDDLRETLKVEYIAPGHCTGEPSFAALRKAFGDHYLFAGLGTTLDLLDTSQRLRSFKVWIRPMGRGYL